MKMTKQEKFFRRSVRVNLREAGYGGDIVEEVQEIIWRSLQLSKIFEYARTHSDSYDGSI